jgi:hypothetical protein
MNEGIKIFISYRRTDTSAFAGRINDRLQGEFGDGAIFMDVDSIDAGDNFQHSVQEAINSSLVFLAIIGRTWASVTDSAGKLRLHEPDDHVRREVSMALQADVKFFPVLVDGAVMPEKGSIPSEIQQIVNLNAIQISHEKFGEDISSLITAISKKTSPQPGRGVDERLSRLRAAMMSTTSTWELERISYELDEIMEIDPANAAAKQLQRMVQDARVYHESSGSACVSPIIHSSDFNKAAKLFIMAHAYGLVKETRIGGEDKWIFEIVNRVAGTQHRDLPGKVKVRLSYIRTNEGGISSERLRELYLASKDEPASMLKLGGAIMAQEDLQAVIHNAETKWRQDTKQENSEYVSATDRDLDRVLFEQYLDSPQFRSLETAGKKYSAQEAKYLRSLVAMELE